MKQVLVLGAGASMPYGLPSGDNLTTRLWRNYFPELEAYCQRNQYSCQEEREFFANLQKSKVDSIDSFTARQSETNTRAKEIATRGICALISKDEAKLQFEPFPIKDQNATPAPKDWFKLFWNRLISGAKTYEQFVEKCKTISFITFNYDRSLEVLLDRAITATFPKAKPMDHHKMSLPIEIIHVYGDLGTLAQRSYHKELPVGDLYTGNIRLIGERSEDNLIQTMKERIQLAEIIFFLGFSYDEENLKVMGFPTTHIHDASGNMFRLKEVYGTAKGLRWDEVRRKAPLIYPEQRWLDLALTGGLGTSFFDLDSRDLLQAKFFVN